MRRVGGFFIRRKIDKGSEKDLIYRAVLHSVRGPFTFYSLQFVFCFRNVWINFQNVYSSLLFNSEHCCSTTSKWRFAYFQTPLNTVLLKPFQHALFVLVSYVVLPTWTRALTLAKIVLNWGSFAVDIIDWINWHINCSLDPEKNFWLRIGWRRSLRKGLVWTKGKVH